MNCTTFYLQKVFRQLLTTCCLFPLAVLSAELLFAQNGTAPISATVTTPEIRSYAANNIQRNSAVKNYKTDSFQPSLHENRAASVSESAASTTPYLTKNPLAKSQSEMPSSSMQDEIQVLEPPKTLQRFSTNSVILQPAVPIGSYYHEENDNAANTAPQILQRPVTVDPSLQQRIDEVLRQGKILEKEERWNEALALYENAIRTFHKPPVLMERFRYARFHHDLMRRYGDSSFDMLLRQLSYEDSLVLYDEVMTKIQTAHVDPPQWSEMFEHGVRDFEIALATPAFLKRNLPQIDAAKIHSLSQMIVKTSLTWEIRNARMLRYGIVAIAENCQKELGLNPAAVVLEFLSGITNSLDPYTEFMTLNQYNDTNCMISGNFVGLGVELKADRESLYINRVIPGSPAEKSGLKGLDRILYVDGKATEGLPLETASNLLQGEAGSSTTLIIRSSDLQQREVRIYREHLKIPSVENVHILNEYAPGMNVGYFKLTGFQENTVQEIVTALQILQRQGMQFLIIDLRDNAGGVFRESINAANLFLRDGVIVRTVSRTAVEPGVYSATPKSYVWDMPLLVLINKNSASASEIFAGAIRDNKRGLIIGQPSFGKDTVQAVVPLYGNLSESPIAGLKLSIETFYSPSGAPFGGIGVQPDVFVAANTSSPQGMNVQPDVLALNQNNGQNNGLTFHQNNGLANNQNNLPLNQTNGTPYQVNRLTDDGQKVAVASRVSDDSVLNEAINQIRRQRQTAIPSAPLQPSSAVSSRYQPSVN